ncbi:DNA internalization-related competence protein ComEC/Rec2 [Brevibacillus sp. B_LB10_24]|uniref:DNA internalization-related competence protein ComEC/Rec2 n=1 Tax=Brevibacillus sp. B_LB10_24 TaxID=3380645 RepID=UPI0038BCF2E6
MGRSENRFFAAGMLWAAGVALAASITYFWLLVGVAAAAAIGLFAVPAKLRKCVIAFCGLIALSASAFVIYDYMHRSTLVAYAEAEADLLIEGIIDSPVKLDGDSVRFFLLADRFGRSAPSDLLSPKERIALRVKLSEEEQVKGIASWSVGSRLAGRVSLGLPDPARNPHGFDYANYLRWQGVRVTAAAEYADLTEGAAGWSLFSWFGRVQQVEAAKLDQLFSNPLTAGYMKSLLLGVRDAVDPQLEEVYSGLGLIHILAISGLHVSLVSGGFLWLLERFGVVREKALLITILFLAGYVMLVGASPSAVRAGLMGGVGLWGRYVKSRFAVLDLWGLALLLMLLYNPYLLFQIGFQLSFAVTLGLICLVPLLDAIPYAGPPWLRSSLAVSCAAQLASFPFLVYWFHQVSPLSWPLNILVVPVLSLLVLPAGYVALLLSHLHPALAFLPGKLVDGLLTLLHHWLIQLGGLIVPFTNWPHPGVGWILSYVAAIAAIWHLWKRGYHRRRDMLMYALAICLLLLAARQPLSGTDEVKITFLDVGQGDSAVVEIGRNTVYLIDGGGTIRFAEKEPWRAKRSPFEVGKDVVVPFLRSRGIERIDRLVLTHGDFDHIGGLAAVIPRFGIGAALVNGQPPKDFEQEILDELRARSVSVYSGTVGSGWRDSPHVRWTWLHPGGSGEGNENNQSVVLLLTAYGKNILFTGDLEREGEEHLMKTFKLPQIDVLKIGHHGSKTSSSEAFLNEIRPKVAVISVGSQNRYGHPAPAVIERLKDGGTTIYRTDWHGAVTARINRDGINWSVQIN